MRECPRCAGAHVVLPKKLTRPSGPFTHYAICEVTKEPMFIWQKAQPDATDEIVNILTAKMNADLTKKMDRDVMDMFSVGGGGKALTEKLVELLYLLMRDELPTGAVADLIKNHIEKDAATNRVFTAKPIEAYARELADRMVQA